MNKENLEYNLDFDKSFYYKNLSLSKGADPSIIYADGKFYQYVTSGTLSARGFVVYESENLTDWDNGTICYQPSAASWGKSKLWAPEVIFDEDTNKYYLFYSAQNGTNDYEFYISVAVSDSPKGPFTEYTSETKTIRQPLLNFEENNDKVPVSLRSTLVSSSGKTGYIKVIDASPFKDPVTGKKYLYFIADIGTKYTSSSFVLGLEMEDWVTPKYETLTKLTSYNYQDINEEKTMAEGGNTNEGCFMYYYEGNYYLTFSTFTYSSEFYQVRQAIATSPLGLFKKVELQDGGQLLYTDNMSARKSAGHHSFVKLGDELFISYHTFQNEQNIDDGRKIAVDRVSFIKNSNDQYVMQVNGLTQEATPLPSLITGLTNIAPKATIKVNGETDPSYSELIDEFIPFHRNMLLNEIKFESGKYEITLEFDKEYSVSHIVIYNSMYDQTIVDYINSIELYSENGIKVMKNVPYEITYRNSKIDVSKALTINFSETKTNKIVFTLNNDFPISLREIMVYGE